MPRKIPVYDDYELIGRVRTDAGLALANSDPILLSRGLINSASVVHKYGAASAIAGAFKPITTSQTYQTPKVAEALEVMADGDPRVLEFGVSDEEAWEVGLSCGGAIRIYLERVE